MTYPYVQAAYDYGVRKSPALGFVVHMAEGGGTVGFLAGHPDRGVSVHYVIEYSGRIVQMLHEDRASGSINPNELRTNDDADGFFGVTACKAVLGTSWHDPNSAVISLEIEGFAIQGPNPAQHDALVRLVNDVRSRHPSIGILGHRDFQNYKSCPGRKIDWASLGGHGPHHNAPAPSPEEPMGLALHLAATTDNTPLDAFGTAKVKGAHSIVRVRDSLFLTPLTDGTDLGVVQRGELLEPIDTRAGDRKSVVVFNHQGESHVAMFIDVVFTPLPKPPVVDVIAIVRAARGAALEEALIAAEKGAAAAIDALPR